MAMAFLMAWALAADAWPGFRGDGTSAAAGTLPLKWSDDAGLAWHAALPGFGQSSPVIHGGRVFVTATEGKNKDSCVLVCVGLADGKEQWRKTVPATQTAPATTFVSRAAPTPAVDAERVYAFWETGEAAAFTHAGEQVWLRNLTKDYGAFKNEFGVGSSLAQSPGQVFVLIDDDGPSYLLALDKRTGKTAWKTPRPAKRAWASPTFGIVAGTPTVVVSSAGSVTGYAAADGKELWKHEGVSGNNIPSATVVAERVLVGAGGDRNAGADGNAAASNLLLEIVGGKPVVKWQAEKATCSMNSPVAANGLGYFVNRAGIVFALDLESGKEAFNKRLDQSLMATPIAAGDRVYFFGRDGSTTVLKTDRAGTELARNALTLQPDQKAQPSRFDGAMAKRPAGDGKGKSEGKGKEAGKAGGGGPGSFDRPAVYGVAAADGRIVLRTGSHLYCVGP